MCPLEGLCTTSPLSASVTDGWICVAPVGLGAADLLRRIRNQLPYTSLTSENSSPHFSFRLGYDGPRCSHSATSRKRFGTLYVSGSGLRLARLALTVAINDPDEQRAIVHDVIFNDAPIDEKVLCVLQTIYHTCSPNGSADWDSYAACRQALFENPALRVDCSRRGIVDEDRVEVTGLVGWVRLIMVAYDNNWKTWNVEAKDNHDEDMYLKPN